MIFGNKAKPKSIKLMCKIIFITLKGLYLNINLMLVLFSVVLTIVVLDFYFRGPRKKRVPLWMR
jgi:hypothetical protein